MAKNRKPNRVSNKKRAYTLYAGGLLALCLLFVGMIFYGNLFPQEYKRVEADFVKSASTTAIVAPMPPPLPPLDTVAYDAKILALANYKTPASTTTVRLWPASTVYPNAGAILPFKRIVAYYGNLYSTKMGILGQFPPDQVLGMLKGEVKKWQTADPSTPVIPALDYIAVTAQGSPGADGKYRFRMPDSQIDQIMSMAAQANAIVFLDIQVGLSNLQTELPLLEKYLKMPQVHLAIDPEFSMKHGEKPGTVIGTMDATDINYAANYLAKLVKEYNLPPKVLVVHRFTGPMVTNTDLIKPLPEVQIVMDMDGWGGQTRKIGTYTTFIANKPVQFTGFKLFYKNDVKEASTTLLTPAQILKLTPQPSYIQYQ